MLIPGFVIAGVTFPGVIVHEFGHKLFCHWTSTRVLEVCYFRFGDPAGYVVHEAPSNIWKHILIDIGPFFINTFFGFVLGLILIPVEKTYGHGSIFATFWWWIAMSITVHAFPSLGDASSIWQAIWKEESPIGAKILGVTLVGFIVIGAMGSVFWLNFLYAFFVVFVFPPLLTGNW
jgi:hypothetical protein